MSEGHPGFRDPSTGSEALSDLAHTEERTRPHPMCASAQAWGGWFPYWTKGSDREGAKESPEEEQKHSCFLFANSATWVSLPPQVRVEVWKEESGLNGCALEDLPCVPRTALAVNLLKKKPVR